MPYEGLVSWGTKKFRFRFPGRCTLSAWDTVKWWVQLNNQFGTSHGTTKPPPPVTNQAKEMASARNARKFYVFPFLGPNCRALKTTVTAVAPPENGRGNPNGLSSNHLFSAGFQGRQCFFFLSFNLKCIENYASFFSRGMGGGVGVNWFSEPWSTST